MNGTASAKATKEFVGKPGRRVSAFRPPEFTASSSIGKRSGATTFAGWRTVRTTERRASRKTWSAKTLIQAGPASDASRRLCGEVAAGELGLFLVGTFERAAGLRQEDIVERRLMELQVRDLDCGGVERPHDVGEVGVAGS